MGHVLGLKKHWLNNGPSAGCTSGKSLGALVNLSSSQAGRGELVLNLRPCGSWDLRVFEVDRRLRSNALEVDSLIPRQGCSFSLQSARCLPTRAQRCREVSNNVPLEVLPNLH